MYLSQDHVEVEELHKILAVLPADMEKNYIPPPDKNTIELFLQVLKWMIKRLNIRSLSINSKNYC